MNPNESPGPVTQSELPSTDEIRQCAYYLYQQSGSIPGHDLDNWLKAEASLQAKIPHPPSDAQPHRHVYGTEAGEPSLLSIEAKILAS